MGEYRDGARCCHHFWGGQQGFTVGGERGDRLFRSKHKKVSTRFISNKSGPGGGGGVMLDTLLGGG